MVFLKVFLFIGLFISGACITVGISSIFTGEFGSGIMITGVFGGLFFIFIKSWSIVSRHVKNQLPKNSDDYLNDNKKNNLSELDDLKSRIESLERDNKILSAREIQRIGKENKGVSGWTFFKWIFIVPLLLGLWWIVIQMELGIW